jgi:hypothetical protein
VQDLQREIQKALNRKIRITNFPWLVMKLAAPFWEMARELNEMRYLWNTDHRLDGTKLARLLPGFEVTDMHTVMTAGLPRDVYPDQTVPRNGRVAVP